MEHYITNDGAKIWTEISDTSSTKYVILCNGGPGCCDYLLPISQMIEDDFTVIRFEQRGCGRSDKDGKYDIKNRVWNPVFISLRLRQEVGLVAHIVLFCYLCPSPEYLRRILLHRMRLCVEQQ